MRRDLRNELAHIVRNFCMQCAYNVHNLENRLEKLMDYSDRDLLIDYAWSWIGRWYKWGGDDPSGFDCSGLAVECAKAIGKLPREGDWTADMLLKKWLDKVIVSPQEGCLAFWVHDNGNAYHVEICVNDRFSIGASGGGSHVKTVADAIKYNAFIKMRPLHSRPGRRVYVDLFQKNS